MKLNSIEHHYVHGAPGERWFGLTFTDDDDEFTVPVHMDPADHDEFIVVDSTQIPSTAPGDLEVWCERIVMTVAFIFDLNYDW